MRSGNTATEMLRLKSEIAALRFQRALILRIRTLEREAKYNENQPRVPAGNPDGGQWTKEGDDAPRGDPNGNHEIIRDESGQESWKEIANEYRPDGTLARQTILNRDGSVIRSEFSERPDVDGWNERHSVQLADGSVITFQNSGHTQTIFDGEGNRLSETVWTSEGSEPQAVVQPAYLSPPVVVQGANAASRGIAAALTLFTWLSTRDSVERTTVFDFRAREYTFEGAAEQPSIPFVKQLTREEVGVACARLKDVQDFTDEGVQKVRSDGDYRRPAEFGTKVHKYIADKIRQEGDPKFKAEVSLLKSIDAGAKPRDPTDFDSSQHYGEAGTIRIDAYEYRPESRTACIYDPKTERARLTLRRMFEMAANARRNFVDVDRIIVTEVKPTRR